MTDFLTAETPLSAAAKKVLQGQNFGLNWSKTTKQGKTQSRVVPGDKPPNKLAKHLSKRPQNLKILTAKQTSQTSQTTVKQPSRKS